MRLPCKSGENSGKDVDFDESLRMIRYAIDHGVNYIDTAYPYHGGVSEVAVGRALKDGYRQKAALADKSPVWLIRQEADFDRLLNEQLKRLGDEHIDYYLLHSLSADSWKHVALRFDLPGKAERAKKAGKIGHIGFSFHDSFPALETILRDYDKFEFGQIQLNYLDVDTQAGLKGLRLLAQKGLGTVIMEPLMGGKLASPPEKVNAVLERGGSGRTPVKWALDFLWDMEGVSVVLSGMSTMRQVQDNLAYANEAAPGMLADAERGIVAEAKKQFDALSAVPCTGCGYCLPCPEGVNIPYSFGAYNELMAYENPKNGRDSYRRMLFFSGKEAGAASCVACRACEEKCPQRINISAFMPQVAKAFEDLI
jgi:hypothetical protein